LDLDKALPIVASHNKRSDIGKRAVSGAWNDEKMRNPTKCAVQIRVAVRIDQW
jgi:hypothetical protein